MPLQAPALRVPHCGTCKQPHPSGLATVTGLQRQLPVANLPTVPQVKVSYVAIALDYKLDESYTPSKMSIRAGTGYHDLKELKVIDVNEPIGWQVVQLEGANPECVPATA